MSRFPFLEIVLGWVYGRVIIDASDLLSVQQRPSISTVCLKSPFRKRVGLKNASSARKQQDIKMCDDLCTCQASGSEPLVCFKRWTRAAHRQQINPSKIESCKNYGLWAGQQEARKKRQRDWVHTLVTALYCVPSSKSRTIALELLSSKSRFNIGSAIKRTDVMCMPSSGGEARGRIC
jgi:hypothetical protein